MQPQPVDVNNSPLLSLSSGWHHIAESFTALKVSFAFIYFSCIEWFITWPVSFGRKPTKLDGTLKKLKRKNASLSCFSYTRIVSILKTFLKLQLYCLAQHLSIITGDSDKSICYWGNDVLWKHQTVFLVLIMKDTVFLISTARTLSVWYSRRT